MHPPAGHTGRSRAVLAGAGAAAVGSGMSPFALLALAALAPAIAPAGAPAGAPPRADSTAIWMRPGVSRELATHRARRIRDVRYELALDVTRRDTARGHVT